MTPPTVTGCAEVVAGVVVTVVVAVLVSVKVVDRVVVAVCVTVLVDKYGDAMILMPITNDAVTTAAASLE